MIDLKQLSSKIFLCPYYFSFKKIDGKPVVSDISDELSELIKITKEALINHSIDLPEKYTDIFDKAWNGETEIRLVHSKKLTEILMKASPVFENGIVTGISCACIPFKTIMEQIA